MSKWLNCKKMYRLLTAGDCIVELNLFDKISLQNNIPTLWVIARVSRLPSKQTNCRCIHWFSITHQTSLFSPLPNAICRRISLSETINLWKDHQRQKCFPVVGWSLRVIDIKKRWTERIPESKQDSTSNIFPLLVFLERRNKEMMVLVDPLSVANPRKRKMTPLPIPSRRGWCIYHF